MMTNITKSLPSIVLNALHVLAHVILLIACKAGLSVSTLQIKTGHRNVK